MKILHVTPSYHPASFWGGPVSSVFGLNGSLAAIPGVALSVLTTDAAGPRVSDRIRNHGAPGTPAPGYTVRFCRRVAGASVAPELLRVLPRAVRWADLVHLTAVYSFPTFPTLVLCRTLHKPLVWSPRGSVLATERWPGARRRGLKRAWEWSCNALVPRDVPWTLHATSEAELTASQARLPRCEAAVIPNGVTAPPELAAREWRPRGALRLLFLGRLGPEKGLDSLLHALAEPSDPRVQLEVCGAGRAAYVASLRELAGALGLDGRVRFVGQVEGERREQAYQQADLCVVPSHSESFSMVVAEALARGLPVIASTGTPWQELETKACGMWVPNTPERLAAAIRKAGGMDLAAMGRRGREWMLQDFSWDSAARRIHALYAHLLGRVAVSGQGRVGPAEES